MKVFDYQGFKGGIGLKWVKVSCHSVREVSEYEKVSTYAAKVPRGWLLKEVSAIHSGINCEIIFLEDPEHLMELDKPQNEAA